MMAVERTDAAGAEWSTAGTDPPALSKVHWDTGESFPTVRSAVGPHQSMGSRPHAVNSQLIRSSGLPERKKCRGADGCPLSTRRRFALGTPRRSPLALTRPQRFPTSPPNKAKTTGLWQASSIKAETMASVTGRHSARCKARCSSIACHELPRRRTLMVGVQLSQSTPCPVRLSNRVRGGGNTTLPSRNARHSLFRRSRSRAPSNPSPAALGSSAAAAQTKLSKLAATRPGSTRSQCQAVRSPCSKERPVARIGSGCGSLPTATTATSAGSMPSSA